MRMLLALTDLSAQSDVALDRSALLARQFKARLSLLHVVDVNRSPALIDQAKRQATALLDGQAFHLAELATARPEILVKVGDPFEIIVKTAREQEADLIVMGARRKRILRDTFLGTTVERVMRTSSTPVLMVNGFPIGPYRHVLLAVDMSEASACAAQVAKTLGLLDLAGVSIVHAFSTDVKSLPDRASANQDVITEHVVHTALEATSEFASFLNREGLNDHRYDFTLEEGDPFGIIKDTVKRHKPDLLVIGTRGHTDLKRPPLGSVADKILRQIECDVLAVPPKSAGSALLTPSAHRKCAALS